MTGADIRGVKFDQKMKGYDPGAVDAHLERLAQMLDSGARPMRTDVVGVEFGTRLRGYNRQEVDAFLDRVIAETR